MFYTASVSPLDFRSALSRFWILGAWFWLGLLVGVTPAAAHVTARLVVLSDSATANAGGRVNPAAEQPTAGQPGAGQLRVALRLTHEEHWHTYWINPGTGYPTTLEWTLPPGWTAGPIQWPTPEVLRDKKGNIVGNGYSGTVELPVVLQAPSVEALTQPVVLRAQARWLMCEEVCVPGEAAVTLTLPAQEADVDGGLGGTHMLPERVPGWTVAASLTGKVFTLTLTAEADATGAGAGAPVPNDVWFFDQAGVVAYDQPQTWRVLGAGRYALDFMLAEATEGRPTRLAGVLRTAGSWRPAGQPVAMGLVVDVPLTAAGAATTGGAGGVGGEAAGTVLVGLSPAALSLQLLLGWVGGLILNLMPCVFPVLGIKILGFVNQAGAKRAEVRAHGWAFTAGVLLSFWSLVGVLALLRAGGAQLGWGFQLQSPVFVFLLAVVMLVFALSLSGLFEIGLSATGVGARLQQQKGLTGSFFTGVLATVVATPCSAPLLGPVLGAALTLPLVQSFLIFTAIALGLAMPYLLLSCFPSAVRALPRPGRWMETFKEIMAFPLYATVGYLVWVLAGQLRDRDTALLYVMLGLVLIALGIWWYGRSQQPGTTPARQRRGFVVALSVVATGLAVGWPSAPSKDELVWETWSPARVSELRAAGKTMYVDFTARWCFTCQTNKKAVFGSSEVRKTIRERGIVLLKADWTNADPQITAELALWGRSAVPFNLLYQPGEAAPKILPELLTAGVVLDALK